MKEDIIKIVIVEPLKNPYVKEVENTLFTLQNIVGGYIETFSLGNGRPFIVCNEEGKLMRLPYNRTIDKEIVVGTFFLTFGDSEGNFVSLNDEQIDWCLKFFQLVL